MEKEEKEKGMVRKVYEYVVRVVFGVVHSLGIVILIGEIWVEEPWWIQVCMVIMAASLMNCVWNFAWRLNRKK